MLPSATEIVCLLGLEDRLCGVSHECDHPPSVCTKPRVVRPLIETRGRSQADIDRAVRETMRSRGTLYVADEPKLREIAPDLVLSQDLCRVCAPSGEELGACLNRLPNPPRILSLNPRTVGDVLQSILEVGRAAGVEERARGVVGSLRRRIEVVRTRVRGLRRPRVVMLEWLDPLFACGHWCPEMVEIAGGQEILGIAGRDSRRVEWTDVVRAAPDVLCLIPCGFHLPRVLEFAPALRERPGWNDLPAVRSGRVFACDADSYFARPGPRIVDGIELLAHLLHPDRFPWTGPEDAFRKC